ncbi:hypothetical protein KIH27_21400 [Mycobacterium sp. M1]|uniref:Uncharacterized protein n=1 Tax=Mycolicibacter acidiphilus TaxID=2835306 RepID=A0ABS5RPL9_9MYCO|nr:hypothetical protein [Mycolicibacter acidiphilus]MBS9536144.1 hypothetical protein [Mycolicibacter acidiphilus]
MTVPSKPGRTAAQDAGEVAQLVERLTGMLDAVSAFQSRVRNYVHCGDEDDEVVISHDANGRLVEAWVQPGLQHKLTVEELEDAINDAITRNVAGTARGVEQLYTDFFSTFAEPPFTDDLMQNVVGVEMVQVFQKAGRINDERGR